MITAVVAVAELKHQPCFTVTCHFHAHAYSLSPLHKNLNTSHQQICTLRTPSTLRKLTYMPSFLITQTPVARNNPYDYNSHYGQNHTHTHTNKEDKNTHLQAANPPAATKCKEVNQTRKRPHKS